MKLAIFYVIRCYDKDDSQSIVAHADFCNGDLPWIHENWLLRILRWRREGFESTKHGHTACLKDSPNVLEEAQISK
jgi:hypothetical protein